MFQLKHARGFHLLELMVCLSIITIFLCMAFPWGQTFLSQARVKQVVQDIESAVRYARNLSYLQKKTSILLPLKEKDWSSGMKLLIENSSQPIAEWKWALAALQVEWLGFYDPYQIRFASSLHHASCSGHFLVRSGQVSQKIVLNRLGRIMLISEDMTP